MKRNFKRILKVAIGLFLVVLIFFNLNLNTIAEIFLKANLVYLFLAFLFIFLSHITIFLRLTYGLSKSKRISKRKIFWSHFFGYLTSLVTPGKLGYLSIAYALKEDTSTSFSSSFLIFSQIVSFMVQIILGFFGLIYLSTFRLSQQAIFFIVLSLLWLLISIYFVSIFFKYGVSKLKFLKRFPKGEKAYDFLKRMSSDFSKVKGTFKVVFPLTLLGWLLSGVAWFCIGLSLDLRLPLIAFIFLNPIIYSLTFVPVTPAGLGIAEAGSVFIFSIFGVKAEKGFLIMVLDRVFNSLIGLLGLKLFLKKD